MATVAVLGAGLLGGGMVENLLQKGQQVRVWNRSAEKLAPLVARGATAAATPAEAVEGASRIHLVLTSDEAVDDVLAQAGGALRPATWIFDHSTNLPQRVASRYAALRERHLSYVPAPVFMSPQNGRDGTGIILLSCPNEEVTALTEILATMTGKVWHVGERPDLAAIHKLAGNSVLVGMAGVLGDTLTMGAAQGLSAEQVLSLFDVFKPGNALPAIGARVAKADTLPVSFALGMARKDVRLMIESAGGPQNLNVLPGVAAGMDRAIAAGLGEKDFGVFAGPRKVG